MFDFLKKTKEETIYSPIIGKSISLDEVPDKVFAQKMVGEGVGLVFDNDTIYSPCDGKVIMVASTKHAIGIKSPKGNEILVHIGLETVAFEGEGFEVFVKEGEIIKAHQKIMTVDVEFFKKNNVNLISALVVTNTKVDDVKPSNPDVVDLNSVICTIKKEIEL